jgi:hypothetical protein
LRQLAQTDESLSISVESHLVATLNRIDRNSAVNGISHQLPQRSVHGSCHLLQGYMLMGGQHDIGSDHKSPRVCVTGCTYGIAECLFSQAGLTDRLQQAAQALDVPIQSFFTDIEGSIPLAVSEKLLLDSYRAIPNKEIQESILKITTNATRQDK